jgi:hypothetical protein
MASGIRGRANPDYSNTEYAQPWGGIDVSKPSSQIEPSCAVSLTGSIIRGGLTNSPTITVPSSSVPVVLPTFGSGEDALEISNVLGVTIIITQYSVYSDAVLTPFTSKTFTKIFTFPNPYPVNGTHIGSLVIGNSLYFSSSSVRGVWKVTGSSVTEITAQNGSTAFVGGDFLFTVANRLCLWNIIGGDGNQTGSIASVTVVNGGSGYPNAGSVLFTGGGGQSATGTFTASGGAITSITVTNAGTGFLSAPTPTIVGTTGTGFAGTTTITGFTTNSTNTQYPDYVAWSFPSAFGSFDPNSTLLGGGFSQITEARGLGTGAAVFEAVAFLAHNGGFTEMVPNTSGTNIEPFTFAPLWSADQGVVCRYGSMAQYGALCCFLGLDQPYQFSPGGLTPMGNKVASLLQNFSLYNDALSYAGGFYGVNGGLYGSIVEIEGEKHYLIAFVQLQPNPSSVSTLVYDCLISQDSWSTWTYPFAMTSGFYQSYDTQLVNGFGGVPTNIARDNWIIFGYATGNPAVSDGLIGCVAIGNALFNLTTSVLFSGSLNSLFRAEAPTINIPQTTRKVMVEYENIPVLSSPASVACTLYGQPKQGGYPSTSQAPISNTFTMLLPNYSSGAPQNAVLTAYSEPIGTANTTLATSLQISTSSPVRIIRASIIAETSQGDLQ